MAKFNVKEELLYFTTFINLIMPANKTLYPSNCILESLQITFLVTQSFLSFLSLWILGFVNLFSYLSGAFLPINFITLIKNLLDIFCISTIGDL